MPLKTRVTQAEIAARAGCHQTTVSQALRGHPLVNAETAERIRALAEKLGYEPDPLLTALATYRSGRRARAYQQTLAVVSNRATAREWEAHPSGAARMAGMRKRAAELGYQIESFAVHPQAHSAARFMRLARARNLRGLILAPTDFKQPSIELEWGNFCAVSLGFSIPTPALHRVGTTPFASAQRATRELLQLGYRRVGLVYYAEWDRRLIGGVSSGFSHVARQASGVDFSEFGLLEPDRWRLENFWTWFRKFRPEVILTSGPQVEEWLAERARAVPRDVAVAYLDLEASDGGRAGIDEHHEAIGGAAVEVVSAMLARGERGVPEVPQETLIEGRWINGRSAPGRSA
jgi:LacI family transcriptional regulator